MKRHPVQLVILCGGSGSRLWPITAQCSKPLVEIAPGRTLLDETLRRGERLSREYHSRHSLEGSPLPPLLVTTVAHPIPSTYDHYPQLVEPYLNDTGVAMARVAQYFSSVEDQRLILMIPADHYIGNEEAYHHDLITALTNHQEGITLVGIPPLTPSIGYGYIVEAEGRIIFREKPSAERAAILIAEGGYWNSGMVIVDTATLSAAIPPSLREAAIHPTPGKYPSFDVAVLQTYPRLTLFRSQEWGWSDVGSWNQLLAVLPSPHPYHQSQCTEVKCYNGMGMEIVMVGITEPLVVVTHHHRLLILHPDHESSYKELVTQLTDSTASPPECSPK